MPSAQSVVEWFDRSASVFPERPAVEDSTGRFVRYRELSDLSRAVQARLTTMGVRPGDRVGILMKKSVDTAIAFHAIMRTGAVYVPVDPLAPVSRAAFMLSDCEACAIFVDEQLAEGLRRELDALNCRASLLVLPARREEPHTWRVEALAGAGSPTPVPLNGSDAAFLLYTSGSTGKPKAVILTHGNVVSFVDSCSEAFAPTELDRFATHAPLHFSLSVFNLYVAWKHGGNVVLIDEIAAKAPQLLAPLIESRGITVWFSTPTILALLAQSGLLASLTLASLRLIMFAGEPFPLVHLRSLRTQLPHPRYVHVLGSTETHIIAQYEISGEIPEDRTSPIPIGAVCSRFESAIIDDGGLEVPPGTDGELCLAGPGVTPGYWKATDETGRAFFADLNGNRWYRTGDLVRRQPDGNLVYRGRRDRMVKKHGNRVELAEIEACLYGNGAVEEAAVVAHAGDDLAVTVKAFVVPKNGRRPSIVELKAHCARLLPSYMVPDVFAFRDALPRTSTGKIDFPTLKHIL